jgi:hypothetical protein
MAFSFASFATHTPIRTTAFGLFALPCIFILQRKVLWSV